MNPSSGLNTPWFGISIGLLGLIIGYGLATGMGDSGSPLGGNAAPSPTPTEEAAAPTPTVAADPATADDDPVQGDESATVTLIEFTDYQCPFCKRHHDQTMGQIITNYVDTGKVKYVVRDFPLGFHSNAQKASEATECADEQGKFWEMHKKIFESQSEWSSLSNAPAKFKEYAKALGLSANFDNCLDSGTMASEVNSDLSDGSKSGIGGTPGFWIVSDDGESQSISGAYPYEKFKEAFDSML